MSFQLEQKAGFELGQIVGSYEFLEVLSSSHLDVAYKVRNHLSQRLEALRVLSANSSDDREGVERFLREIKVHARLLHPNIVTFYNAAELEGQLVMTTELIDGITLAERLKQMGPLPWCEAVSHITQILEALGYAHDQGIIHRNVTPETVILTADTTVKLSGFGLAKPLASPSLTQAGSVMGSVNYIPPEQIRGLGTLDARSDLYSVGMVFYEALTGRLPFEGHSQFQVMLDHVSVEPPAPSSLNPQVPPEFDSVILTALAKDPASRFQTADQFRARLESVKNALRAKSGAAVAIGTATETAVPQVENAELAAEIPAAAEPAAVPEASGAAPDAGLLPSFAVEESPERNRRHLLILGLSALASGVAAAIFLAVAKL